jgi:hypothetical protein
MVVSRISSFRVTMLCRLPVESQNGKHCVITQSIIFLMNVPL